MTLSPRPRFSLPAAVSALMLGLAASGAHAGPFLQVTGPGPGPPPGVTSVGDVPFAPPSPGNGDFNPAPDLLQYLFAAGGFMHSGTVISPSTTVAIPAITLTGPPAVPAPAFFNPGPVTAGAAYIVGGPGNTSIRYSDVYTAVPPGIYALVAAITGFVYFPTATPGAVLVTMTVEGPFPEFLSTGAILNPGVAGSIVQFTGVPTLFPGPQFRTGAVAAVARIDVSVVGGPAAVYLPASAEVSLQVVPEPSTMVLSCVGGLTLLGFRFRRRGAASAAA